MDSLDSPGGHFAPLPPMESRGVDGRYLRRGTVRLDALQANGNVASSNFVTGVSGWIIRSDGTAEFAEVTVRGNIIATGGEIAGDLTITAGGQIIINAGTNEVMVIDDSAMRIEYYNSSTQALKGQFAIYGIAGTGAATPVTQMEALTSGDVWMVGPGNLQFFYPEPVVNASSYFRISNSQTNGGFQLANTAFGVAGGTATFTLHSTTEAKIRLGGNSPATSTFTVRGSGDALWFTVGSHGITVSGSGEVRINDANTYLTEGASNSIRLATNSGYIDIGPRNTGYGHIYTDRPEFAMNKPIMFTHGQSPTSPAIGHVSYGGNIHLTSAHQVQVNTGSTPTAMTLFGTTTVVMYQEMRMDSPTTTTNSGLAGWRIGADQSSPFDFWPLVSSARYKNDIEDIPATEQDRLINVVKQHRIRRWHEKPQTFDDERPDRPGKPEWVNGIVAEEAYALQPEAVILDGEGQPHVFDPPMALALPLLAAVQDLIERVEALEVQP